MKYRNIEFDKIAKSEQQLQSLSFSGINYDKKLKKTLTEENPSVVDINMLKDFEDKYNLILTEEYKNFYWKRMVEYLQRVFLILQRKIILL